MKRSRAVQLVDEPDFEVNGGDDLVVDDDVRVEELEVIRGVEHAESVHGEVFGRDRVGHAVFNEYLYHGDAYGRRQRRRYYRVLFHSKLP